MLSVNGKEMSVQQTRAEPGHVLGGQEVNVALDVRHPLFWQRSRLMYTRRRLGLTLDMQPPMDTSNVKSKMRRRGLKVLRKRHVNTGRCI